MFQLVYKIQKWFPGNPLGTPLTRTAENANTLSNWLKTYIMLAHQLVLVESCGPCYTAVNNVILTTYNHSSTIRHN